MKPVKETIKYIVIGLTLYLLPVLLFGDFSSIYQYISLPIILFILYQRMISRERKFDAYINGALLGLFLTIYHLCPFSIYVNNSIIGLTFTYSNIVGYWVSFLSYYISHTTYRFKNKELLLKKFDYDWTKIEREQKIDSILNKW